MLEGGALSAVPACLQWFCFHDCVTCQNKEAVFTYDNTTAACTEFGNGTGFGNSTAACEAQGGLLPTSEGPGMTTAHHINFVLAVLGNVFMLLCFFLNWRHAKRREYPARIFAVSGWKKGWGESNLLPDTGHSPAVPFILCTA